MSTDRETTRIVRSWLEDGATQLPDRVLDAVLDNLPATHQRRVTWWPRRTTFHLNKALAVGGIAAVGIFVAILGINYLAPGGPNFGDPGGLPTPTPSSMEWPNSLGTDLAAGTYLSDGPAPVRSTISVPRGWVACGVAGDFAACAAGANHGVSVLIVDNVVRDPCDPSRVLLDPPVGESVDDLVSAISNLSGFEATDPIRITLDGFVGKEFELTAPTEPNCENGLGTWTDGRDGDGTNGVSPGEVNLVRIIDVDGVRVMIAGAYQPSVPSGAVAELRAVFESVRVSPQP